MGLQLLLLLLLPLPATCQVADTHPVLLLEKVTLTMPTGNHVKSGTNVKLQCTPKITSSTGKSPIYQYTFYKDSTTVHTENRTSAIPVEYSIPQARVANSGVYKCIVKVMEKLKESNTETLNVTGLQTPVLILSQSTVTEGEEVMASCSAPKETGSIYFYFYEGSKTIKTVQSSSNLVNTGLHFLSNGNKSVYCSYDIDLHPGLRNSNKSKAANVYVQELSISPSFEIKPNTDVIEGDTVSITCNASGSHRNSIIMHVSKNTSIFQSGPNSVIFSKRMLSEDSGVYECKLEMGNVLKTVNRSVMVSELFSKPVLTMEPEEVFEKELFSLTCFSLKINDQRIRREDVKYNIYLNNHLLTRDFTGKHRNVANTLLNGSYTCSAEASGISKRSKNLVFKAKALVSKPLIKVSKTVILGKQFEIQCHCENGSLPISYTLLNNKVPQSVKTVRQANDTAFFTATIKRKEDVKNFTCEAENNGNSSKKESDVLNITVVEPVSKPNLLIMPYHGDVTEGEELYLQCTVREGTPPITFKWYRSGSDEPLSDSTTEKMSESFKLKQAKRNDTGTYRCIAENQANEVMWSEVATISVSLAKWKKGMIGALCILLLVLLIGFGCYRYRARRGKRETATELSVKPSSPKSEDSLTVSLAHDTEVFNAHKDSGDAKGRSIWSERESDTDTDDQSSEEAAKEPDVEYTEVVHLQPADSSRDGADHSGYGSVEYAQLNHDLPEPV